MIKCSSELENRLFLRHHDYRRRVGRLDLSPSSPASHKKTVLLLDKRADPPGPTQKVGESLVQLSGYYLSKVLDLEEHLLREHYLKYNLRFQWKTEGYENTGLEDYNKSFIPFQLQHRHLSARSHILEAHMLEVCKQDPRFQFEGGVERLDAEVAESGRHRVSFSDKQFECDWLVYAQRITGPGSPRMTWQSWMPVSARFMRSAGAPGCRRPVSM